MKEEIRDEGKRRVTSIVRKLHFALIRKKLGICLLTDVLLFALAAGMYLLGLEMARTGSFGWDALKNFDRSIFRKDSALIYLVKDAAGRQLLRTDIRPFLTAALSALLAVALIQLLCLILAYAGEDRRIRRILNPINEIALRADELSRFAFTEDKYQLLEDAIGRIRPGEEEKLSFGDADLEGIEAAMNNLLIRMRDTYRQQARFVNDASHELRTPIAVIEGYANMLDRWGKEDEKILDESISAIRNESAHMKHLVEQLLFLARGDSGKTVIARETTDLADMMQETYEESFMIDETHPYRFRPGERPLVTEADAGLLKQAVRILIDNAAKYTNAGDEIVLGCGRTEDGSFYLSVQDTGIGMAEADVQHMFERFYRSDEVRSYRGTGLGLSIAKWIVDKHAGHFEILSRTGLGTRIRIVLPASS